MESDGVTKAEPRLAVVIINWNSADNTIECLESLLRSDVPLRAIVVDNASQDDSVSRILAWASGERPYTPPNGPLARLTTPPLPKPVAVVRLDAAAALNGPSPAATLTLIDAGENLGFAGGNNLGLKFALRDPGLDYFWCLNNDTVVEPSAARALLTRMDATHKAGMCGTVVRYYHRPGMVQALNGSRFKLLTGQSEGIGRGAPASRSFDPRRVARDTDFVLGASLAVSRPFLQTIGLMDESYFLYFEEMDWSVRNRGRFQTAFAHGAVVYHKEGGAIGSSGNKGARSDLSEYYLVRSRIRFYWRNFPLLAPIQYPLALGLAGRRLLRRQPGKAATILRAMLGMSR